MKLKQLTGKSPIIGIIGSTRPTKPYYQELGILVGYYLKKALHELGKGVLFTGGVTGVGVDVYAGIASYCIKEKIPAEFLTIIPETYEVPLYPKNLDYRYDPGYEPQFKSVKYKLPGDYNSITSLIDTYVPGDHCRIIRAGLNMEERRKHIANIPDMLVLLNGGYGTLDEAQQAVTNKIPVVVLAGSGGVSDVLIAKKFGGQVLDPGYKEFLSPYNKLDPQLIRVIGHPEELVGVVKTYFP